MILWLRNTWRQTLLSLFALSVLTALLAQREAFQTNLPGNPLVEHSGKWAIRFLLFSLLMTPLNTYFGWRWAVKLRKTAGLWAFGFGMLHFITYAINNLGFPLVELILFFIQPYILLAVGGLSILTLMAITSNQRAMKWLGKNWKRLHRLVYIASLAVVIHSILAASISKTGFLNPLLVNELKIYLGLLILLLMVRLPPLRRLLLALRRPRLRTALTSIILSLFFSVALAKVDPYVEDPAHEWGGLDAPMSVWSPTGAVGLFGRLDPYGDVDAFAYTFDGAYPGWRFEVIVPACGLHFKDVYPSVALAGAGLNAPADEALPFDLPEGMGAVVFTAKGDRDSQTRAQAENTIGLKNAYESSTYSVNIPQSGLYTLMIWEPEGNIGAYALATGGQHDRFAPRPTSEREASWELLFDGQWMRQDCDAPLALESCPATVSQGQYEEFTTPLRNKVGEGFVLSGSVRDSSTCLPVKGAEITYWLANEQGEYDDAHEGMVLTNAQGLYRIETNIPGQYENVERHIHFTVSAPGYQPIISAYLLRDGLPDHGVMPIVLRPD